MSVRLSGVEPRRNELRLYKKSKDEAFLIVFVWRLYKNDIKYGNNSIKIEYIKKRTIKTGDRKSVV